MEDIVGMQELERTLRSLEKVPQTVATKAARAGAAVARKAAKSNAPVDTGALKRGVIMKHEKRQARGKAVYDVMMDPAMNDVFVKVSKSGKRSYYPASQEYGYFTVDGRYIPGYRYLRKSVDENKVEIESKIMEMTAKEVDKVLRKR